MSGAGAGGLPDAKNNAKPVEVYDLEGNLLSTYRSGKAAAEALGLGTRGQGEVSQCCRGLKTSYAGYRFKFPEEFQRQAAESAPRGLKRGYAMEYVAEPSYGSGVANAYASSNTLVAGSLPGGASSANLMGMGIGGSNEAFLTRQSRTSRASRGDQFHFIVEETKKENPNKALAQIKTRKWTRQLVTIGSLQVMKWVPNQDKATAALQINNPSHIDGFYPATKKSRSSGTSRRKKK